MKRHTITLGASTTAGGKVVSASSRISINGVNIALEGDMIFCPACRSNGKIVCAGARIPETWNGKIIALENDVCGCSCVSPPRLIPIQVARYQITEKPDASTAPASMGWKASDNTISAVAMFDDRYVLIDEETGDPLPQTEYALRRKNGQV